MKKIIITLIIFVASIGIGIWLYNTTMKSDDNNQANNYQAERSDTKINISDNSNNKQEQRETTEPEQTNQSETTTAKTEIEMAQFTTKIYNKDEERQNNIGITCNSLTNTEIQPGATFSFCDTVGKSTSAKGYQKADIYVDGQKTQGLGGGNCQVSTTLYNTVIQIPELEVIERHTHSGNVPYIQDGKDAAVAYGSYDFKFKNNSQNVVKIIMTNDAENINAKIMKIQ